MPNVLPAPCVIVLIEASGSGKSTWAADNFRPNEIVSSDRVRGWVGVDEDDQQASQVAFAILEAIVDERLAAPSTTQTAQRKNHHTFGLALSRFNWDVETDQVAQKLSVLEHHCEVVNRDIESIQITHRLRGRDQLIDEFAKHHNAGIADDVIGLVNAFREAGAQHTIVTIPDVNTERSIEEFGRVIEAFNTS